MTTEESTYRIEYLTRTRANLKAAYNELRRPPKDYAQCSRIRSRFVEIDREIRQLRKQTRQ